MKVYMGPYKNWFGPYQIAEKILFWMDKDDDRVDKFGEWLNKTWVSKVCDWYYKNWDRKIEVRIDRYDTWGMDHTLAPIILPMLKQLKASKHGSPFVDQEDLPVELRLSKREQKVNDEGHWNKKLKATEEEIDAVSKKFHSQWDWVMDQMIWSFERQLEEEDEHKHYYDPYAENEELEPEPKHYVLHEDGTKEEAEPLFDAEFRRKMGKFNKEKYTAYQERKQLGFTLFGKYYQSLWD